MIEHGPSSLEAIKILIASDVPEQAEAINVLLRQAYLPVDVIAVAETKRCLQMARDFGPDVVLFIDEEADVPASEVSREIYQTLPGTVTIVLARPTEQEDVHYLRQALLAGAKDVLPLPPLLDNLITSIQQANQLEKGRRGRRVGRAARPGRDVGGRLIAVYSPKGGAGRSVIAANLSVFLAKMKPELRVVLFDLDLQFGDQRILLDLEPTRSVLDLVPVIDELTPDAVDSALTSHASGLRVLLAPPEMQQADLMDEEAVRKILIALRAYYDVILVDLPAALTDVALTALEFADQILQICTLDVLSVRRTRAVLDLYDGLGIPRELVHLVLNQTSERGEIKPEDIKMLFEQEVIGEIPSDRFFIQPYVNTGVPLADAPKAPPIVQSLEKLAAQLVIAGERTP